MSLVKEIHTKLESNTFLLDGLDNWIGKNIHIIMKTENNSLEQQYHLASSESNKFIQDFEQVDSEGWEDEY